MGAHGMGIGMGSHGTGIGMGSHIVMRIVDGWPSPPACADCARCRACRHFGHWMGIGRATRCARRDGHAYACGGHVRRLACHLGVLSSVPTVGVGKSLHHVDGLSKEVIRDLGATLAKRGDHAELVGDSGRVWGALLRTSEPAQSSSGSAKPVIVSVGHGLSLDGALALVRRGTGARG